MNGLHEAFLGINDQEATASGVQDIKAISSHTAISLKKKDACIITRVFFVENGNSKFEIR